MYQLDFNKPISVFFIGIGGISMSALASILLTKHFSVSGSDWTASPITHQLEKGGARIVYGHQTMGITPDVELVVYTAAVHPDNPEFAHAISHGLPMLTRAEFLGQLMSHYQHAIGVSGTHGKTTTTGMLSYILMEEGVDPTITVGGVVPGLPGGNMRLGGRGYFLTEACEYTNSFLRLSPTMELILNIEEDHLDFFKDLDDIRASFRKYMELLPKDGYLIINRDIPHLEELTAGLLCEKYTYSLTDPRADFLGSDIVFDDQYNASFTVFFRNEELGRLTLCVPGPHNASNALAACAAAMTLGIDFLQIQKGLSEFPGANRRFQRTTLTNGAVLVRDYAHHPHEIAATLASASHMSHRKVWVIFQPHTYTRTKALFSDFVDALSLGECVILADIYAARETDTLGVSSLQIQQALQCRGVESYYFPSFSEIEAFLSSHIQENDLILVMGAGDIVEVATDLETQIGQKQ